MIIKDPLKIKQNINKTKEKPEAPFSEQAMKSHTEINKQNK